MRRNTGNNFYPQPNTWVALMMFSLDMYCILVVIFAPFVYFESFAGDDETTYVFFQGFVFLSVFSQLVVYLPTLALIPILQRPLQAGATIDTFNIDALIAGTEQTMFTSLRASFDDDARDDPAAAEPAAAHKEGESE